MAIKPIKAPSKEVSNYHYHLVEDKQHIVEIIQIIDLGIQHNPNSKFPPSEKYLVVFEVLDEEISEGEFAGKHPTIDREYSHALGKNSGLVKDLLSRLFPNDGIKSGKWIGSYFNFDISQLIGKHILIDVVHSVGKKKKEDGSDMIFPNISGFSRLGKGTKPPISNLEHFTFSLSNHDEEDIKMLQEHGPFKVTKGKFAKLPQFAPAPKAKDEGEVMY